MEREPLSENFLNLRIQVERKGIEVSEAEKRAKNNQAYEQNNNLKQRYDNFAKRFRVLFSKLSNPESERYEVLETEARQFIIDCDLYLAFVDRYLEYEIPKEYIQ